MPELRFRVTSKQKKFVSDAQVAWEEFEDAIFNMCKAENVSEDTAMDLLAEMRQQIEMVWGAYEVTL